MTIESFATQTTGQNQNGNSALLSGNGLGKGLSADFLDLLLGQINVEELQTVDGNKITVKSNDDTNISEENPDLIQGDSNLNALVQEKGDLALLKLALLGQAINENSANIEQKLSDLKIEKFDNRVNQLSKIIDHLTNGLPSNVPQGGSIDALVSRLQERLENLEARIDAFRDGTEAGDAFPLLIATGLNPSQLTSITNRIEEVENKLGRELTAEDLIAGIGNIIPAPGSENNLSPADMIGLTNKFEGDKNAENLVNFVASTNSTDSLAKRLNDISVAGKDSNPAAIEGIDGKELAAATAISNSDFNALKNKTTKTPNLTQAKLVDLATSQNPLLSGFNGGIALPENWQSYFADVFETMGINIDSGIPVTPTMLAAHVSTSIQQAGQPHAATQMIAANMAKAAQNGAPTQMTIQLDPPELGRVNVKLDFGPDKTIKAHIIIEKPETFLLLQKDVIALERALENAGLETSGDSLSFELAADEYAFNGEDKDGSESYSDANSDKEINEDDSDIINTTMTWDVDPETGHVHYNIIT